MRRYIRIDTDGYYLRDIITEDAAVTDDLGEPITAATHIEVPAGFVLQGLVRPRRVAGQWVEGGSIDLPAAKRSRVIEAQAEQERRLGLGFRVIIGPSEFVLSSDAASRERLALIATSLANGKTFPVGGVTFAQRDGDPATVTTIAQFRVVLQALEARLEALAIRNATLTQAIRNAPDATALAAIDVSAGWPAV